MTEKSFINGVRRYELTDIESYYIGKDGYLEYKEKFESSHQMGEVEMPSYVILEVNNYCNMKCKMCIKSYDSGASGRDNMPMDLLDKVLNESHDLGVRSFFLGGGTECLINPNIKTIIKHVKELGKGIDDVIITNGYCLTDDIIDLLIEYQWEKVFVSLDAATPETYKRIRGRDLSIVEENIRRLVVKKNEKKTAFPIIRVSFCIQEDNKLEQKAFFDKWKDVVDIIDYQNLVEYSDLTIRSDLPKTNDRCVEPFSRLFIDCKGNIMPCCKLDWCKHLIIGNARNKTIKEAWESPLISKIRKDIRMGNLCDVCKTCMFHTMKSW